MFRSSIPIEAQANQDLTGAENLKRTVKVRIYDEEYLVKSEEDDEQVHKLAQYVNDKLESIREGNEGLSEKKALILAALHIASDYFQLLSEREGMLNNIRRRTETLIYDIDSALG